MKNIVSLFLTLTFVAVSWAEPPRIAIRYEEHLDHQAGPWSPRLPP